MSTSLTPAQALTRNRAEAERRWFYGGGVHTWLARAEETGGAYFLHEDAMEGGKVTPLHTHPAEETLVVLDGEIVFHLDGVEHGIGAGGIALAPRDVPHAFKIVTPVARLLVLHTPGTCEAFYRGASEPLADGSASGPVDLDRVMDSGRRNGGFDIVGPPPFSR